MKIKLRFIVLALAFLGAVNSYGYEKVSIRCVPFNGSISFDTNFFVFSPRRPLLKESYIELSTLQRVTTDFVTRTTVWGSEYTIDDCSPQYKFFPRSNEYSYSYSCPDGAAGNLNIRMVFDTQSRDNKGLFEAIGYFNDEPVERKISLSECR